MASYTVGQIRRLYYVNESTFANTPASALSYCGEIARLAMDCNFNPELVYLQGSRAFQASFRGPYDVGYSYKAWCRANSTSPAWNWVDFWATYGIGSTTALTESLPSFSALTGKTVGATNNYNLWNGCKANRLSISCEKPGTAIEFEMDLFAQMVEWDTDKTFTQMQNVTVGADPTLPTTDLVTWRGCLQINLGGGLSNISPSKFALTVTNNLKREYGTRVGAVDAVSYPVALWLQEDKAEISVEMTLPHGSETYNQAKKAGTTITALTIPVDNKTITLTGGVFAASDFPDYSQAPSEETVKANFTGLTIA